MSTQRTKKSAGAQKPVRAKATGALRTKTVSAARAEVAGTVPTKPARVAPPSGPGAGPRFGAASGALGGAVERARRMSAAASGAARDAAAVRQALVELSAPIDVSARLEAERRAAELAELLRQIRILSVNVALASGRTAQGDPALADGAAALQQVVRDASAAEEALTLALDEAHARAQRLRTVAAALEPRLEALCTLPEVVRAEVEAQGWELQALTHHALLALEDPA